MSKPHEVLSPAQISAMEQNVAGMVDIYSSEWAGLYRKLLEKGVPEHRAAEWVQAKVAAAAITTPGAIVMLTGNATFHHSDTEGKNDPGTEEDS